MIRMFHSNLYRVLELERTASSGDISAAYKRLVKQYHPDVNKSPVAVIRMKDINQAYYVLHDEGRRAAYDKTFSAKAASAPTLAVWENTQPAGMVMRNYFRALQTGNYEAAYDMLSAFDQQYVTKASFSKWRRSVQKLFSIREFEVRIGELNPSYVLEPGRSAPACRIFVSILEKDNANQTVDRYQIAKFSVWEVGEWRVFLGYRDLNEIARVFEDLSERFEHGEMTRRWEEYCTETCRELDIYSLNGLIKHAGRELYRFRRYNQPLVVACLYVESPYNSDDAFSDLLEAVAKTITSSLRETDLAAYIGGGVFTILYVHLKRRNARSIVERLTRRVQDTVQQRYGISMHLPFSCTHYTGDPLDAVIDKLTSEIKK